MRVGQLAKQFIRVSLITPQPAARGDKIFGPRSGGFPLSGIPA